MRWLALIVTLVACTEADTSSTVQESSCRRDPGWHTCWPRTGDGDVVCKVLCQEVSFCGTCIWTAPLSGFGRWVSVENRLATDCPQDPPPADITETRNYCMAGRAK